MWETISAETASQRDQRRITLLPLILPAIAGSQLLASRYEGLLDVSIYVMHATHLAIFQKLLSDSFATISVSNM
jgi:hypothetical protein